MSEKCERNSGAPTGLTGARRILEWLTAHACSALMFGALFCTLAAKLFHAMRTGIVSKYHTWVLSDIAVLLLAEAVLASICYRWRRRAVVRIATGIAAVLCTWSVMNAGWLIRTGTQIVPRVLLPLFRDPLNALLMVGVNLYQAPTATVLLLGPSAVALAFLFYSLAKGRIPAYKTKRFFTRLLTCVLIAVVVLVIRPFVVEDGSLDIRSLGLRHNSQFRALGSIVMRRHRHLDVAKRDLQSWDAIELTRAEPRQPMNVVVVVLEGVQYKHTSLWDPKERVTPFLRRFASEGVEFSNMRSVLTHTTKALFSLLTGRFPSASQDLAETVPAVEAYMSLATVLKRQLGYRTAFFQSAKGNFEARPGLVHNLGFEKFYARDDLGDPNHYVGYLACDEFAMLEPVSEWIRGGSEPFLLVYLCSVTHDHYEVPEWFAEPARDGLERYRQTIAYTDTFLGALDARLSELGVADETILCVAGDHGEAFGEHGLLGHERIAFDEVLRVPFCLRAPYLVEAGRKIEAPCSSVDVVPTVLGLLGFDCSDGAFDGMDMLSGSPVDRKVYFGTWIPDGPGGYVKGDQKMIYNPSNEMVLSYNLGEDPAEAVPLVVVDQQIEALREEVSAWRSNSIFRIQQTKTGKSVLFGRWRCWWNGRVADVKYDQRRGR